MKEPGLQKGRAGPSLSKRAAVCVLILQTCSAQLSHSSSTTARRKIKIGQVTVGLKVKNYIELNEIKELDIETVCRTFQPATKDKQINEDNGQEYNH